VAVLQVMGKNKVLVKVHPEGKYVVDLDKSIEMSQARQDSHPHMQEESYLPNKPRICSLPCMAAWL
jgi:26S proteasome regulatory subunit T6